MEVLYREKFQEIRFGVSTEGGYNGLLIYLAMR